MNGHKTGVSDCVFLNLNRIHSESGNLTVIEQSKDIPFDIKRIYYINDVPDNGVRGSHAHKRLMQFVVATSGWFDMLIDDGVTKRTIRITSEGSGCGMLLVPGIWRELTNFSKNAVCLVLASMVYEEKDYIRDYNEFLKYKIW